MLEYEYVFEMGPTPECHASTLVEHSGSLIAAWFAGTREGAQDVAIWLSRRGLAGGTWSEPTVVASGMGVPCWNPVLCVVSGSVYLFYKVGPSPQTWSGAVITSTDGGRTWSQPQMLPAGILGPVKNKPLVDGDVLICGSSVESYQLWGCWVEISPDRGKSWSKHGPINVPGHLHGIIQPTLVRDDAGRMAMLCRSRGLHRVVRAESADDGRTWSPAAAIDLPQNNSGLDAVRLRDGRVVLLYNHTTQGRTPLNLAVSADLGKTWKNGPVVENEPGEFSYPAIIQSSDGKIRATYTWKRRRVRSISLDPADLG